MDFDLSENALLGDQHHLPLGKPNRDNEGAEHIIDEYDVRAAGIQALTSSLSGGNQQKFLVGREIEREPDLIVASNPTRGLDVGSIEYIHEQLLRLRRNDQAVLMVSSKLDELRQLSDRLAVIYEGEIVGIVDPDDSTEREIGLLMAGESVEQADLEEKDELPGGGEPA
jgi:simple sugar transport system ATP-binding protein